MPEFEPRFRNIEKEHSKFTPHALRPTQQRKSDLKYRYSASRKTRSLSHNREWYEIECIIDGEWESCCILYYDNGLHIYSVHESEYQPLYDIKECSKLSDMLEKIEEALEK